MTMVAIEIGGYFFSILVAVPDFIFVVIHHYFDLRF